LDLCDGEIREVFGWEEGFFKFRYSCKSWGEGGSIFTIFCGKMEKKDP